MMMSMTPLQHHYSYFFFSSDNKENKRKNENGKRKQIFMSPISPKDHMSEFFLKKNQIETAPFIRVSKLIKTISHHGIKKYLKLIRYSTIKWALALPLVLQSKSSTFPTLGSQTTANSKITDSGGLHSWLPKCILCTYQFFASTFCFQF